MAFLSLFFLILMRLETFAEDDDDDDEEDDEDVDEAEETDELEVLESPEADCMVSRVSEAMVLLLLVRRVRLEVEMLPRDVLCFLFSLTALCIVF